MSQANAAETDPDEDSPSLPPLPAGARNYITPAGYAGLKAELFELIDTERPKVVDIVHWAASNGDRSENGDYIYGKKRLRGIDRRIRFLTQRLELAEITDPSVHHGRDQIFFGATVVYLVDGQTERCVTIMGIDEADSAAGEISWVSPGPEPCSRLARVMNSAWSHRRVCNCSRSCKCVIRRRRNECLV